MKFRKWLTLMPVAALILLSLVATACGKPKASLVEDKVNVVASFYPLYDFTKKIGGDHVNVINLVPTGVEPHDWSPKSRDMQNLSKAQMFVYLGAGFEGWVHDTLGSLPKDSKVAVVEASKGVQLLASSEEEHNHSESSKEEKGHEHNESEYDPHVWLSPVNAKIIAQNIKDQLVAVDGAHKSEYEANFAKLAAQLDQLHAKYKDSLTKLPKKQIVVTHQSFGYLAKEYGLSQMPILGLSPDSEPTSKDLQAINEFIRSNHIQYIFFEELVSDRLAKTLAKDAKVETLVLNPVEGLTEQQAKSGADYISLMESNLNNLIKALQ
ncbi:metal ABC transporter substrate-binding protein [Paenibacillus rigui]|uniref:ABC transporter substrate-binding protein n=1 Tax=Paenibacillus rigui TaxID=554312 RepID=A0A229UXJ1_9BACL|nr:metal ABC transporter substrate-binding protein [Paenibacillus rigui]OXM88202.1 ABC transporter substrate-binding protein [Paenibacillus rigui]